MGKRAETADDKPRPLKVTFGSEEDKLIVLKGAKNLKNKKEGGLDKVFIYPDLTPKQREARKKLVVGFERYRYWVLGIGRYLQVSLLGDTV